MREWMANQQDPKETLNDEEEDDFAAPPLNKPRNPPFPQIISHGKQPVRMQSAPTFTGNRKPVFTPLTQDTKGNLDQFNKYL